MSVNKKMTSAKRLSKNPEDILERIKPYMQHQLLPDLFPLYGTTTKDMFIRYKQGWFASATQCIPSQKCLQAVDKTREQMKKYIDQDDKGSLKKLLASISTQASQQLCSYYAVSTREVNVLFGTTATQVLYSSLLACDVQKKSQAITVIDIGQTLRRTLSCDKPIKEMFGSENVNFLFDTLFIHTFTEKGYMSDKLFLATLRKYILDCAPDIYIIPTVTSTGHILPFKEACLTIRSLTKAVGKNPLIILDDAQGIGRISKERYKDSSLRSIFTYADIIIGTGSKVLGALPDTGFALVSKKKYKKNKLRYFPNPLSLVSLSYAFESFSNQTSAMKKIQKEILVFLEKITDIQVLSIHDTVPSIIGFYVKHSPKKASVIRDILLSDPLPITLPKIISTKEVDYLRISLDPKSIVEENFRTNLNAMLQILQKAIQNL